MASLAPFAAVLSRIPAPIRGALWMVTSCACFSTMTALIRHLTDGIHPFEVGFFRNLFGLVFVLPWLWRGGLANLRTQRIALHGLRAMISLSALLCWFTAVSLMPIAEVTALSFTTPLFATIGAALFLHEVVRMRRWLAIAVGFAGTMIILRPGVEVIALPALLALAASAFIAVSVLLVKSLSRTESAATIVFYMALLMTPLSLAPALFVWTTPPPETWAWLVALGLVATLAHLTLVRAFATGDASAVLPFDFSRLIFVALLGYVFFGERPDVWTWIGAAVIFGATLYSARHETRRNEPVEIHHGTAGPI